MTKADFQRVKHTGPSAILERAGHSRVSCPFLLDRPRRLSLRIQLATFAVALAMMITLGCSILSTRPVQEMSDTAASIRAAREVQADTLAPELFRQANEWFFKAKHEYKFKNFDLAKSYAERARKFAEDAEFESMRNGGSRTDAPIADPMETGLNGPPSQPIPTSTPSPYAYPTPTGVPASDSGGNGSSPPGGATTP